MHVIASNLLMKLKMHTLAAFCVVGGLSGAAYFGTNIVHTEALKPVASASTASRVAKTLPRSQPVRLRIPAIDIDASFVQLGLKADGTLETPNSPTSVGWYQGSPTPGELGPSVIAGHVDYIHYGEAVFWRLHELKPGDIFYIDRADGTTAKFKVSSVQQFSQDSFPTQAVYGNINYAGIRLITCGGTFNRQTHHYSDNTVVFGSLVS